MLEIDKLSIRTRAHELCSFAETFLVFICYLNILIHRRHSLTLAISSISRCWDTNASRQRNLVSTSPVWYAVRTSHIARPIPVMIFRKRWSWRLWCRAKRMTVSMRCLGIHQHLPRKFECTPKHYQKWPNYFEGPATRMKLSPQSECLDLSEFRWHLIVVSDRFFDFRLMYYCSEPNQVIVLEDISEKGYFTLPHTLDLNKAIKAATKLARFHAASYYLYHDVSLYGVHILDWSLSVLIHAPFSFPGWRRPHRWIQGRSPE